LGPVQYACGIISPTKTTNIVEIRTAIAAGTTLLRKIGRHSIAKALAISRVESRR